MKKTSDPLMKAVSRAAINAVKEMPSISQEVLK
jgi:hypothetical protein